jgi:hypothetical protein
MESASKTPPDHSNPLIDAFISSLAARFGCSGVLEVVEATEDLAPEALQDSVIYSEWLQVSADRHGRLLDRLKRAMADAPAGLVVAPRASEASTRALRELLERAGLNVDFMGTVPDASTSERNVVAVLAGRNVAPHSKAPDDFRVVAIMPTFNEADIIVPSLESLIEEGLEVYLLDNWSTDGTERLASRFLGRGLLGIERFPPEGPRPRYELRRTLQRVAELAESIEADWIVANDADEVRRSPWPGVTLRDAIYAVDRRGFNAIDYTNVIFEPTDDSFPDSGSLQHFHHFRFGSEPWHLLRINSWKRGQQNLDLVASGGHEVQFDGRRVFPYKFLLKHYQIRSQKQGERKVFRERKARWAEEERALGWHVHYDQIQEHERFIRDPATLLLFDERTFHEEFLIERLSGIGTEPDFDSGSRTIAGEDSSNNAVDVSGLKEATITEAETASVLDRAGSADAEALGVAEAEVAELRLRVRESEEREQRLIERVFEAEEGLAEALATEHELRVQIGRYAQFYQALQRSRPWRMIQFLRRLMGREW